MKERCGADLVDDFGPRHRARVCALVENFECDPFERFDAARFQAGDSGGAFTNARDALARRGAKQDRPRETFGRQIRAP